MVRRKKAAGSSVSPPVDGDDDDALLDAAIAEVAAMRAIPLHKDPSSEQVLDLFLEHVVSRHGAPRRVISDSGSNIARPYLRCRHA